MIPITGAFIKEALANHLVKVTGELPSSVLSVCIDSRIVKPRSLFFAIVGESLDGHAFIDDAVKKGASLVIAHQPVTLPPSQHDVALIQVDDTLRALHALAKHYLAQMPAMKIGLTGSSGKTSTKELIHSALIGALPAESVFVSKGNLNNHFGVPLMAFEVEPEHQIAVFEMGMNNLGEIATLANIVMPHIGLIINIGEAHSGNLGGIQGVAQAKAELYEALGSQDIALVNIDNIWCVEQAKAKAHCALITFGSSETADVRCSNVHTMQNGIGFDLVVNKHSYPVTLPLLGHHNAINAAAAIAVVMAAKLDIAKAIAGLSHTQSVSGRLKQHTLKNGVIVLDDSYNANPQSMLAGLATLVSSKNHRHIAVLGDMLELGEKSHSIHHAIGKACGQQQVAYLFACGEAAQHYLKGAQEAGLTPQQLIWAQTSDQLAPLVANALQPGDVVWIKGSHSIKMEQVVRFILENHT